MTDDAPYIPPFELHSSRSLRRLGIKGRRVSVGLGEGALFIAGSDGKHMLVGSDRHRAALVHRLQLRTSELGSIILRADNRKDDLGLYAHLVGDLARWLEREGRLDAVRIGLPRLRAFASPVIVGGGLAMTPFLENPAGMRDTPREQWILIGLVVLLIVLVTTGAGLRQGFHRRVRTAADLDRFLARA